jgi:hypothetical protein
MVVEHLVDVGIHHDAFILVFGHEIIPVAQVLEPIVKHYDDIALFLPRQGIAASIVLAWCPSQIK